ncbi:MAG: sugar phosphate isomerase/epimerase family protein [Acidobacteriota bacterium]
MVTRRSLLSLLALQPLAKTRFTMAGMTLPWSAFSFPRALEGIKASGFHQVAWGVNHQSKPLLPLNADSKPLAQLSRNLGLTPIMMFSTVNLESPNAVDAHLRRLDQAREANIPYLLTFGKTTGGQRDAFVKALTGLAPRASGVTILIKQHGGNTGTGELCARIIDEVNHPSLKLCYDAGNVMDYENADPIKDLPRCARHIRAFNIKDHRNWPKDEDCGPGYGEIDHYRLLEPVLNTGLEIPLTFENISQPLLPRPTTPEQIDHQAQRAREYMETVIGGLLL